jgi:nucleoside-diphosphate-sugar epimerase
MADAILVTGASGQLGQRLIRRLLERAGGPVLAWLHAADEAEFEDKRARFSPASRLRFAWGDLRSPDPFARVDPSGLATILHAAAVTRFNVEREVAEAVNVEGTAKLVAFARRCPGLERLALLSSVYASGLARGAIAETPLGGTEGFANHYEWSKWRSEQLLLDGSRDLPWQVFRVATAIADDEAGRVSHQNAFHNTLKLLFYGLLSVVPGEPDTPLYFVTAEFAAASIDELVRSGDAGAIYHVCHSAAESLTLGQLVDLAFERFEREEDFKRRRILRPLFCDAETFDLLAEGVDSFGGAVVNQGLGSVRPFARQLFAAKSIANERLVAALERYAAPNAKELVERTCEFLVRTRWGRRPDAA